jgi:hypothetical protein
VHEHRDVGDCSRAIAGVEPRERAERGLFDQLAKIKVRPRAATRPE